MSALTLRTRIIIAEVDVGSDTVEVVVRILRRVTQCEYD